MTKNEYIALRIEELEARRNYAAQMVMNRDMAHEVKMCDVQIQALMNERDLVVIENPLPKIGPLVQLWLDVERDGVLMHTDDHGIDTVLCENHVGEALSACRNCKPWPSLKNLSTHNRNL